MLDNNHIPSNIRFLRAIAGLSQEQLAKEVNLNRGNITSYERGVAKPAIETLKRIADFFNIDLMHVIQTDLTKNIGLIQNGQPLNHSQNNHTSAKTINETQEKPVAPPPTSSNHISSMLQEVTSYEIKRREAFYQNVERIANSLERIEKSLLKLEEKTFENL